MAAGRYFFNILDGKLIVDTDGTYCASWGEMREQAVKTAGECLQDMASKYPSNLECQLVASECSRSSLIKGSPDATLALASAATPLPRIKATDTSLSRATAKRQSPREAQ